MLLLFAGKGIILLLCLLVLHKYPLTEHRVNEIQAELERRRKLAAA
jgi:Na+/melibiose symporter-like transporter